MVLPKPGNHCSRETLVNLGASGLQYSGTGWTCSFMVDDEHRALAVHIC